MPGLSFISPVCVCVCALRRNCLVSKLHNMPSPSGVSIYINTQNTFSKKFFFFLVWKVLDSGKKIEMNKEKRPLKMVTVITLVLVFVLLCWEPSPPSQLETISITTHSHQTTLIKTASKSELWENTNLTEQKRRRWQTDRQKQPPHSS